MGVTAPTLSQSENNEATIDRHSRAAGHPEANGNHSIIDDAHKAIIEEFRQAMSSGDHRAALRAEAKFHARRKDDKTPAVQSLPILEEEDLDCYYEPLTPEDQAIFNYNSLIESGEFEESEITFVPPSEAAHRDYAIALKQMQEAAASEGIPLLPNPLAGTLEMPAIRSP